MTRSSNTHRRTAVALSATALLAVAIVPSVTNAETDRRYPPRRLVWNYVQEPAVVSPPLCDPNGGCVVPFSVAGVPSTTGDIIGTAAQAGAAVVLPDGSLYANSTAIFTGTLGRCGSGTVAMRSTGFNRAGVTSGEIVIVDGSGTGELAGISGAGTVIDGRVDPTTGRGLGTIVLTVRCSTP